MSLIRDAAIVLGMLFGVAGLAAMALFIVLLCAGYADVR